MLRKTSLIDKPIYQENKNDEQVIQLAKNNAELDLLSSINEGYKNWLNAGNEGSTQDYLDSLSIDDLKTLSLKEGGIVDKANRPKEPGVKQIDLMGDFHKLMDMLSKMSPQERRSVQWLVDKTFGKKK